jgi:hypothetical protein
MSRIDVSVLGENNPLLTEKIRKATTSAEIRAALEEAMVAQGAKPGSDPMYLDTSGMTVHSSLVPTFKRVEVIQGVPRTFEGTSEADLTSKIVQAYRDLDPTTPSNGGADRQRDDRGRFSTQPVAVTDVEKTDLELQFKRGDISTADYLRRSGALDEYAREKWGIDTDAVATNHQMKTMQQATEEFLNSEAGATWPGGQENLRRMTRILADNSEALGLDKGDLTSDMIAKAYAHMRENNLLAENEEVAAENAKRISEASSPEELRAAANAALGRGSSGWFGGR